MSAPGASGHRALVLPWEGKTPSIAAGAFVAPNATVIGDVVLAEDASVWFGAVVRGDIGPIRVGARTNVQDLACIHLTEGYSTTEIGADVTIGHGAILHGCKVADGCLIGMGAVVLDNAEIGAGSVIAAGSVVPPRRRIPPGSMVMGNPGKVVRAVTAEEADLGRAGALHYVENARRFVRMFAEAAGAASGGG